LQLFTGLRLLRTMVRKSERGTVQALLAPGENIFQNVWRGEGMDEK